MKLTERQKRFADYYIKTGNATESARKAGYSSKTAQEMGYENLRKPHIGAYIEERNAELESKRIANMTEVKEFWTSILRDGEQEAKDRLKASEYIAKTNAAFVDRTEHSGHISGDVEITIGVEDYET